MLLCPKCNRKRRCLTSLVKVGKKKYWVSKCVECKTAIKMEDTTEGK